MAKLKLTSNSTFTADEENPQGTSPLITADWEADGDNRWTVPIGGGIGAHLQRLVQPINANIAAYYNVVTPDDTGANWQLRAQWTFLFPTH